MSARSVFRDLGTRPEAIGMTPIVHALRRRTGPLLRTGSAIRLLAITADEPGEAATSPPVPGPHGPVVAP